MGFRVHRDTPPMERELIYLLYDLCVKWGFCIPPVAAESISRRAEIGAQEFASLVLEADGVDAEVEVKWLRRITEKFRERFNADQICQPTFTNRVRGNVENW